MPNLHEGYRVWVEECEREDSLVYILVIENNQSQDSIVLGKTIKSNKSDKTESLCHSWRRHLAEILNAENNGEDDEGDEESADYDISETASKTGLLQYFAKDSLKPLPPLDDIILAGKVIEYLVKLEPGIKNLENLKGTLSQVGEHEITLEELIKLHAYYLNRKPPHPF